MRTRITQNPTTGAVNDAISMKMVDLAEAAFLISALEANRTGSRLSMVLTVVCAPWGG